MDYTVIIPNFNRKNALKRAVNSVFLQTIDVHEIIIVDDGSQSDTLVFTKDLIKTNNKLRLIINSRTKGASGARNSGLEEVSTEFVAFLDSDDWWDKHHIESLFKKIYQSKSDIVYSWSRYIDQKGTIVRNLQPSFKGDVSNRMMVSQVLPNISCFIFKTVVAREVWFDESMLRGNDGDFLRNLSLSHHFDYFPFVTANISIGAEDRISFNSRQNLKNEIDALQLRLIKYKDYYSENTKSKDKVLLKLAIKYYGYDKTDYLVNTRLTNKSSYLTWNYLKYWVLRTKG